MSYVPLKLAFHYRQKLGAVDSFSPSIVDPIKNAFWPPQRIGIIKNKKINSMSWINMATTVYFNMRVTAMHRNDYVSLRLIMPLRFTSIILHIRISDFGSELFGWSIYPLKWYTKSNVIPFSCKLPKQTITIFMRWYSNCNCFTRMYVYEWVCFFPERQPELLNITTGPQWSSCNWSLLVCKFKHVNSLELTYQSL